MRNTMKRCRAAVLAAILYAGLLVVTPAHAALPSSSAWPHLEPRAEIRSAGATVGMSAPRPGWPYHINSRSMKSHCLDAWYAGTENVGMENCDEHATPPWLFTGVPGRNGFFYLESGPISLPEKWSCLTDVSERPDPIMAACKNLGTQQWKLDEHGRILRVYSDGIGCLAAYRLGMYGAMEVGRNPKIGDSPNQLWDLKVA